MAWVRTIRPEDADGPLREEYERALRRAGRVAPILRISSLHPKALSLWIDLYLEVMHGPSPLTRRERELVAVVVSATNGCHY
ncbi:MAG TPA: carboxymuconolactone decarboxylase family protein [Planctomycetota bacterium]|nr:carboxymuconolactone decarboxylase family protein [Planctomycetota bacterium]